MAIDFEDFLSVDIRVGTISRAEPFPEARKPAIKLWIDFGVELGQKKSSAQITDHYNDKDIVGKQVLAVVNFSPKQIGSFFSECLVLGVFNQEGGVVLISPDRKVPNGKRLQ